jgi:hypothetical protein
MKILMKVVIALLFVLLLPVTGFCDNRSRETAPAQSIPELQRQLETILKDTHTPGMSVAIAHRDGAEWIAGLGTAAHWVLQIHRPPERRSPEAADASISSVLQSINIAHRRE